MSTTTFNFNNPAIATVKFFINALNQLEADAFDVTNTLLSQQLSGTATNIYANFLSTSANVIIDLSIPTKIISCAPFCTLVKFLGISFNQTAPVTNTVNISQLPGNNFVLSITNNINSSNSLIVNISASQVSFGSSIGITNATTNAFAVIVNVDAQGAVVKLLCNLAALIATIFIGNSALLNIGSVPCNAISIINNTTSFAISGFPSTYCIGTTVQGNIFALTSTGGINTMYNGIGFMSSSAKEFKLPQCVKFQNGVGSFLGSLGSLGTQSVCVTDNSVPSYPLQSCQGNIFVNCCF